MRRNKVLKKLTSGVVAGLAGTAIIQTLQIVGQKKVPEQMPPMKQHPGEYMVEKAERLLPPDQREKVPRTLEKTVAQMLGVGYGLTFGALFELLHRKKANVLLEGTALGLVSWAAGYLGWLPATGIMPRVTKQKPVQVMGSILSHILYGVSTAGTSRFIGRKRFAMFR